MKKTITFLLVLFLNSCSETNSQELGKIVYIFPDEVEISVSNYIDSLREKGNVFIFLKLGKKSENTYYLHVSYCSLENKESLIFWVNSTNRYAVIRNSYYPLLLDYDYDFSTKTPLSIGNYGERAGQILRTMPIYDGYSIMFTKKGITTNTDF